MVYTTASGRRSAIANNKGTVNPNNNWLKENWRKSHSNPDAVVNGISANIVGGEPGYAHFGSGEFGLTAGSPCIIAGAALTDAVLLEWQDCQAYTSGRSPSRVEAS